MIHPEPVSRFARDIEIGDQVFYERDPHWRTVQFIEGRFQNNRTLHYSATSKDTFAPNVMVIIGFEDVT
jgi:hypothetical protein